MNSFPKIKRPFILQGSLQKKKYFEGWYFKQVNGQRQQSVSFIFGFSTNPQNPHSFIQVIKNKPLKTYYISYPLDRFKAYKDGYQIGQSTFSSKGLSMNIDDENIKLTAELQFSHLFPLDQNVMVPSIMGPFAYIPNMECNHGIVSMHHEVDGYLEFENEVWSFEKDKGYIEKDWGQSFPSKYIWLQAHHFEEKDTHFMLSIANIPFMGSHFEGIIAQLNHPQLSKRMATYFFAKASDIKHIDNQLSLTLRQGKTRWVIHAEIDEKADLKSPQDGLMMNTIKEGLGGKICIEVYERDQLVLDSCSQHCGIEIEGY